ncbi:helix-turn-helix transcriptional regulator [Euzebya sp.]|uniref:helix-turn-helix transcriptional regulator n=1 Tax=Euzebya sp. TaxID=1971409 RepID=UPI0035179C73
MDRDPPSQAQLHRALSSPARTRLLEALREMPGGGDAQVLATRVGLHANTVRAHLAVLEEAGLVVSAPEARDRPGRPRLVYTPTERATGAAGDEGAYQFLATILTGYLSAVADDPAAAARDAGAAWGRHLVDRPGPFERVDSAAALDVLVRLLDDIGFAPELDDDGDGPRVLLRRCPFLGLAKDHQEVVCSVHLGLMRGALAELGGEVEARDLLPLVEPMLCISHLTTS